MPFRACNPTGFGPKTRRPYQYIFASNFLDPKYLGVDQAMLDRIFKSEDGPGPVEYALMLAILIALGVGFVGTSVPSNQSAVSKAPVSKTAPEVKVGNLPESATNR